MMLIADYHAMSNELSRERARIFSFIKELEEVIAEYEELAATINATYTIGLPWREKSMARLNCSVGAAKGELVIMRDLLETIERKIRENQHVVELYDQK